MPSHDRVGLDNDGGAQQRRHEAIEPHKEQSVPWREPWPGRQPALQQIELRRKTISASSRARDLNGEARTCRNKPKNETIPPRLPDLPVHYRVDRVFGRDTSLAASITCIPCGAKPWRSFRRWRRSHKNNLYHHIQSNACPEEQ